jgi:hypothetical protein
MPRKRKETLVLEKEEVSDEPKIAELNDNESENSFKEQSESEYEEDLLKKALEDESTGDSNEGDSNEDDSNEGDSNEDESNEDESNEEGRTPQIDPMMNMMNQMFGGMMPPPQSFMGGQQRQEEHQQEEETDLTDILSVFFHDSNDKNVVEVLGDIKTSIDKNSKCILKLTQVLQEHLAKK